MMFNHVNPVADMVLLLLRLHRLQDWAMLYPGQQPDVPGPAQWNHLHQNSVLRNHWSGVGPPLWAVPRPATPLQERIHPQHSHWSVPRSDWTNTVMFLKWSFHFLLNKPNLLENVFSLSSVVVLRQGLLNEKETQTTKQKPHLSIDKLYQKRLFSALFQHLNATLERFTMTYSHTNEWLMPCKALAAQLGAIQG